MLETPDITVLIKAPNQKHEDHPVQCRGTWTVYQLKDHLAENYPTKPTLREQRLIYSGQLLTDDSRLGDVLRPHDDDSNVHTVHLVCAPPAEPPSGLRRRRPPPQQQQMPPQQQQQPQHQQQPPQAAAQPAPAAAAPVDAPLPQPYDLNQWAHMLQNNQHQLMAMQQLYSQYWAQYAHMMQYNPASMPMIWPQPMQVPPAGSAYPPPAAAAPAPAPAPAPAAQGQPPPAAAPQNVRLNAQGGVLADDEDEAPGQWDWLDWLHGFARLAVLFLAVYFYASMSRLVLVLGFGFLAYLYNQGWFQQPRAPVVPPVAREPDQLFPPPRDAEEHHQHDDDDEPDDGRLRVSAELREVLQQMGVEPPLVRPPHPLTLAWTFFTSFFASLVPERID
ncbi:homocysteine-responsive endoplasmic reticulum-resident ubiquitin-like domain member 2 protein [Pollicipes pollicipes]|uniref:homocysteine-responsive endoplasmic reticulum-resident ubiquitin-like domain member 2 protein n=1 Tax=Pollicipes pollicipes TaxID=41117 RepID=UPI001885968D|nr:homocysteine-responsive endoplasmic reticulum-resident ubiquitin-like domain member 2 protein [Pollicipes pollicipes]